MRCAIGHRRSFGMGRAVADGRPLRNSRAGRICFRNPNGMRPAARAGVTDRMGLAFRIGHPIGGAWPSVTPLPWLVL